MVKRAFLGEFEHLVLATALRLRSGYGAELDGVMDLDAIGGLVTKAVSREPRVGEGMGEGDARLGVEEASADQGDAEDPEQGVGQGRPCVACGAVQVSRAGSPSPWSTGSRACSTPIGCPPGPTRSGDRASWHMEGGIGTKPLVVHFQGPWSGESAAEGAGRATVAAK